MRSSRADWELIGALLFMFCFWGFIAWLVERGL